MHGDVGLGGVSLVVEKTADFWGREGLVASEEAVAA